MAQQCIADNAVENQKIELWTRFLIATKGAPKKEVVMSISTIYDERAIGGTIAKLIAEYHLHAKKIGKGTGAAIKIFANFGETFAVNDSMQLFVQKR